MSENNNLSIDEIIKRAQQIKAEAEKQLQAAEKSLDEKAKAAIDEVVVDEDEVAKRLAEVYAKAAEEEDIKEFVPSKKPQSPFFKSKRRAEADDAPRKRASDDDVKTALPEQTAPAETDGKTRGVLLGDDKDMKLAPQIEKTRTFRTAEEDEKTKKMSFVSTTPEGDEDSELQQIPTLVSSEHIENFNNDKAEEDIESAIQMTFEGFDDKMDSVNTVDEELAERELEKRREEKIGKFRLFGPDETDSALGDSSIQADDYDSDSEHEEFLNNLYSKKTVIDIKLILTTVLFVPLLLMTIFKDSAHLPLFLSAHTTFFGTTLALYAAVLLLNFNVIAHGLNIKKKINFDFPVSIVALLILAHNAVMLFYGSLWIDGGAALAPVGVYALFMSQLGKRMMMARIIDNFEFVTGSGDKFTVENITNTVDATIISRGLLEEPEPKLKMSVKCDFPTNFLEISCKREPADRMARRIFLLDIVLSAALCAAVIIFKNVNAGINAALCALTVSMPVSALFLTNAMLSDISAQLSDYESRVCGYEGAFMAQNANALVMEAADLFDSHSCDLHGIKTFGGAKVDDAIIHAAAVMIQTRSPLAHVFDEVIIGQQSILPKVESLTYEEKMGTSAWIYKRKVLVGTREMMQRHEVGVPQESFEQKFTVKNRKALYLAVDGQLMAMFIVSYSADPDLKRELKKLEKSDLSLLVKSADPYINEESLCTLFKLPHGFIRVMNYSAARAYDKYSGMHVEKSPAYVVHNGSALGLVSAMRGAGILVNSGGLLSFLLTFGALLGFGVTALLFFLQESSPMSALSIIVFQSIWTGFMLIVTRLRGLGL